MLFKSSRISPPYDRLPTFRLRPLRPSPALEDKISVHTPWPYGGWRNSVRSSLWPLSSPPSSHARFRLRPHHSIVELYPSPEDHKSLPHLLHPFPGRLHPAPPSRSCCCSPRSTIHPLSIAEARHL